MHSLVHSSSKRCFAGGNDENCSSKSRVNRQLIYHQKFVLYIRTRKSFIWNYVVLINDKYTNKYTRGKACYAEEERVHKVNIVNSSTGEKHFKWKEWSHRGVISTDRPRKDPLVKVVATMFGIGLICCVAVYLSCEMWAKLGAGDLPVLALTSDPEVHEESVVVCA